MEKSGANAHCTGVFFGPKNADKSKLAVFSRNPAGTILACGRGGGVARSSCRRSSTVQTRCLNVVPACSQRGVHQVIFGAEIGPRAPYQRSADVPAASRLRCGCVIPMVRRRYVHRLHFLCVSVAFCQRGVGVFGRCLHLAGAAHQRATDAGYWLVSELCQARSRVHADLVLGPRIRAAGQPLSSSPIVLQLVPFKSLESLLKSYLFRSGIALVVFPQHSKMYTHPNMSFMEQI